MLLGSGLNPEVLPTKRVSAPPNGCGDKKTQGCETGGRIIQPPQRLPAMRPIGSLYAALALIGLASTWCFNLQYSMREWKAAGAGARASAKAAA